jgi:hypothetical protein
MMAIINDVLFSSPVGIPASLPSVSELIEDADGAVSYDLRTFTQRFHVNGVVGHMSQLQFKGMVYEALRVPPDELGKVLRGTWKPVAAQMTWGARTRLERQDSGADPDAVFSHQVDEHGTVRGNPQRTKLVPTREQDILLHVAVAEMTQRPVICPLFESKGIRSGNRYGFAHSHGQVSKLSVKDAAKRDHAKRILQNMAGGGDQAVGVLTVEHAAKVALFLGYNMSAEEIAGALNVELELVEREALKARAPTPKPKARKADAPSPK